MSERLWEQPRLVVLSRAETAAAGTRGDYVDLTNEGVPAGFYSP